MYERMDYPGDYFCWIGLNDEEEKSVHHFLCDDAVL